MMSKTSIVPAAVPAPAPLPGRPLFAPRPRRLATGPAPAALIVLVWMALWAWVSLGVAAPLSRLGGPDRARAVQQSALRAATTRGSAS